MYKNTKFEFSAKTHFLVVYMGLRLKIAHIASVYRTPSLVCGPGAQPPQAQQTAQAGLRKGANQCDFYHADQPISRKSNNRYAKFKIKINLVWDWCKICKEKFSKTKEKWSREMVPTILEPGTRHVTRQSGSEPQSVLGIWAETLCVAVLLKPGFQESSIVMQFNINYNCF